MKRALLFFAPVFILLMGMQTSSAQSNPRYGLEGLEGWVDQNGVVLTWRQTIATEGSLYYIYRSKDSTLADFVKIDSTADTSYIDNPAPLVGQNLHEFYQVRAIGQRGIDSGLVFSSNMIVVVIAGIPPVGSYALQAQPQPNDSVELTWNSPPTSIQGKYFIWRRINNYTDVPILPTVIDSTTDTIFTDKPPVELGEVNAFIYQISVSSSGGSVLRSSLASVGFFVPIVRDTLTAAASPILVGEAGKMYAYNPMVTSTDTSAKLKYSLIVKPDSMKIDSTTGEITWTPSVRGWYSVEILVTSNKLGYLRIAYNITVSSGDGVIVGTVKDTANDGIRNVGIFAYQRDGVRHLRYFTKTDTNGFYRLNLLDPGNYVLQAVPYNPKYVGSWYNKKVLPQNATVLVVVDSTSPASVDTANIVLKTRVINQPLVSVNGWILDTAGLRIKGSYVVFVRAQFALNGSGTDSLDTDDYKDFFNNNQSIDWRLEGISEHVFLFHPDSLGKYHASVPMGSYIAFARAEGYPRVFYNNESSLLAAQIIRVTGKIDSIGFTLTPFPPYTLGQISGQVVDTSGGSNTPVISRVMAFRDRWYFEDSLLTSRVYEADSDSLGQFTISALLPGTYRILAIPLGGYVPTFYSAVMPSRSWAQSMPVGVNGISSDGLQLITKPIPQSARGYAGITGIVTGNSGASNSKLSATAAGVAGLIVYATDQVSGDVLGYGVTDITGTYSISGLAPGSYNVTADAVGLTTSSTQSVSTSYDSNGNPVVGSVSFSMNSVTSVQQQPPSTAIPKSFVLNQNYPNPFNPSTTISFSVPQGSKVSLKIYNILGQEVANLVDDYRQAGNYSVQFNASKLASGVYFYRLQANDFAQTKKLLLLK